MKKVLSAGFLIGIVFCFFWGELLGQEPIMLTGEVNLDTACSGGRLISVSLYLFRDRTPVEDAMVRLDEAFTVPYSGSGAYFLKMKYTNPEPGMPFTITVEAPGLTQPVTINGDFAASLQLISPKPEAVVAVSAGEYFEACWRSMGSDDSPRVVIQNLTDRRGNVTLLDRVVPGTCLSLPPSGIFAPEMTCRFEVSQELDTCTLGGDYFPGSEVMRSVSASCTFRTR